MNVAIATSAASWPSPFMTASGGDTAVTEAGTRTPPQAGQGGTTAAEPLTNRFPSIAFSYDVDASRLVMLYRDPANGKTVSQIPTEAALKQYKEAQEQEKAAARASTLQVTVGGPDSRGSDAASGRGGGRPSAPTSTAAGAAALAHASSGAAVSVAHFSPATPHPAAASAGVARVNVVI